MFRWSSIHRYDPGPLGGAGRTERLDGDDGGSAETALGGGVAAGRACLLVFATLASATGFTGAAAAGSWGPSGHGARAMRVRSSTRPSVRRASAALVGVGAIKGEATDALTKAGIGGIEVCAWAADEEDFFEPECTLSASNGKYEIAALPAGEYIVEFATPFNSALNYVGQFYSGASSFKERHPCLGEIGVRGQSHQCEDGPRRPGGRQGHSGRRRGRDRRHRCVCLGHSGRSRILRVRRNRRQWGISGDGSRRRFVQGRLPVVTGRRLPHPVL